MAQTSLTQLNPSQQQAVTHTGGPMLIVAGAGTGKTRVITSRILHLLLEEKVPSSRILALTFTEKATEEMIARVDEAMPLSYEEVTMKTFHGFCETILRERGMEIGIDPGYRLLTQADQWLFLKKHLFELELDYYRPLGNPNKFLHTLLGHFSRLKDEDIQPAAYIEYAQNALQEALDDAGREDAAKMLEVAQAYDVYQRLMLQNNCLDFGDLQFYALRLFEKRPSVLREFQDRFQYLLVDEFQDTNFAQNKLIMMLAEQRRNLTVVGDDDQSIYKWRGASLSNIYLFEKRFPEAIKVVLTDNYRSAQAILDAAYHVIQNNNPDRLEAQAGIDKRLVARGVEGALQAGTEAAASDTSVGDSSSDGAVEVRHFSHYLQEVGGVVDSIQELARSGIPFREIAILVRANQHAAPFVDALEEAGIPFSVRDTQGLLRFEEIKDLVALLRFVARPQDDVAFFRLLSLPLFNIPMAEVLQAVEKARTSGFKPLFYHLRDALQEGKQTLPGLQLTSPFAPAFELFNTLLNQSRNRSVTAVLGEFLNRSGYVKVLTEVDSTENGEKIQHIADFLELAKNFGDEGPELPARAFLEYLDSLQEATGGISASQAAENDAISVLTVHSSKGLEFEHVFVPSLVNQRFPSTRRSDPMEIPRALLKEELPETDMHLQEERRLFYVACTRAKRGLHLSYSDAYEGSKKWKLSPFVAEILASGKARETGDLSEPADARQHQSLKKNEPDSPMTQRIMHVPESSVNQLSYSKLDAFTTCPLKYKFRYYFKIPTPQAHAANFGSSVHNTVNRFYEELKAGALSGGSSAGAQSAGSSTRAQPRLERLKELYEQCWINAGYESKGHEQARKKQGLQIMERFFAREQEQGFKLPAFLERSFRLKIGSVAFTGRIDRIDKLEDGTYEVVDYKTGSTKRDINLKKDLQLSLYALACRDIFKLPVSRLSLYYLEDAVKASTERTDEELEAVKAELKETVRELRESDLSPTPGFHCGFCEYRVLCHAAE